MKRRSLPVAAALAAPAALLTACVGGDGKSSDDDTVVGTDQGTETPKKPMKRTTVPADKPDGVDVSLPKDMDLVFDWDKPKDQNEAVAMDNAANFFRAIHLAVNKRTTKGAAVASYATGSGLKYAQTQSEAWVRGGWTATGTLRHCDVTTRSVENGTSVEVAICADSRKFYGKEVRTGKILTTDPSIDDFDCFKIIMVRRPKAERLWQASKVFVETKAAKCR
ncbi:hypothetical protein B9W64_15185 [Streptomyces sp. CS159]|uniref:hypothetical protein n=1 Tax=Streptomyces sp. CS159 TaxID=1982762 RepID=UPI000B417F5D|nr:hypothetical protein [Streptomyces sp. CS159]OWA15811.1 hypothetical protein B9W64_15185 [Streptomyces sp. CS159]